MIDPWNFYSAYRSKLCIITYGSGSPGAGVARSGPPVALTLLWSPSSPGQVVWWGGLPLVSLRRFLTGRIKDALTCPIMWTHKYEKAITCAPSSFHSFRCWRRHMWRRRAPGHPVDLPSSLSRPLGTARSRRRHRPNHPGMFMQSIIAGIYVSFFILSCPRREEGKQPAPRAIRPPTRVRSCRDLFPILFFIICTCTCIFILFVCLFVLPPWLTAAVERENRGLQ